MTSIRPLSPPRATDTASQQPSPEAQGAFFIGAASRTNPKTAEKWPWHNSMSYFSAHITTKAEVNAASLLVLALSLSVTVPTSLRQLLNSPRSVLWLVCPITYLPMPAHPSRPRSCRKPLLAPSAEPLAGSSTREDSGVPRQTGGCSN